MDVSEMKSFDTVEGRLNLKNLVPCFIGQHSSDHTWYIIYIYIISAEWDCKCWGKGWGGGRLKCQTHSHCHQGMKRMCLQCSLFHCLLIRCQWARTTRWRQSTGDECQQEFTIWLIYLFRPWGNSPPLTPPPAPLQNGWNHQNYFSLLNLS